MQLVLNTKSMIENQNGGKKNESIRCRICKEFYPHGKRWMGVGMAREQWRKPFLSYPAGRSGSRKGRF